jgi:hypothetical protein
VNGPLRPEILAAGAAGVLLLAGVSAWFVWRARAARRVLGDTLAKVAADVLRDVTIPDGAGGGYHIDYLVRSAEGIVILDIRTVTGAVFAGEPLVEWTVMGKAGRFTFPNPLGPLYDRIAAVSAIIGVTAPVLGRVVFQDGADFRTALPPLTLRLVDLPASLPPAAEAGDAFLDAWTVLVAAAVPSPPALRRR